MNFDLSLSPTKCLALKWIYCRIRCHHSHSFYSYLPTIWENSPV